MDIRSNIGFRKPPSDPINYHTGADFIVNRAATVRPLSDIRELTEPSLFESIDHSTGWKPAAPQRASQADFIKRKPAPVPARPQPAKPVTWSPFPSPQVHDDKSSVYSIPVGSVPPRSSSKVRPAKRSTSVSRTPAILFPLPKPQYRCVTNNGQSQSPVKEAARRLDPGFANRGRIPSRTVIKLEDVNTMDILTHPVHQHHRVRLNLVVVAPLFVGGSSVEGSVHVVVDDAERTRHRKSLTLTKLSIDLLGVEDVSGGRQHIFLALGNALVDLTHLPPVNMVETQRSAMRESSWILIPSASAIPFLIRLPLEVGPPPFQSKHASIRYILSATLMIKDGVRSLCVRTTQETAILSVYDPEKALKSLPSPLTVTETCHLSREEQVTITAGLHRQVWVSGTNIFADVHIINDSHKTIKKIELQLERRVLCYRHAAASTLEMSASQARIFDQDERVIASRSIMKPGISGWNGVAPHSTVLRTCDLELPRHHATIKCNKYFEVRYFLNVIVGTSTTKPALVQLPIILIHMNSLDVPTNSVAQVAAAIEEKRARRTTSQGSPKVGRKPSRVLQGRAFNAPRMQSLERARKQQEDIVELGRLLDASPRKNSQARSLRREPSPFTFKTPPSNRKGRIIENDAANEIRRRFGHMRDASQASNATTNKSLPRRPNEGGPPRAGSALAHRRAVSLVSNADTNKSVRRRPNGNVPRASSALGNYSVSAADIPNENVDPFVKSYAASAKNTPSLVSSFEIKKPKWPKRPDWLKGG